MSLPGRSRQCGRKRLPTERVVYEQNETGKPVSTPTPLAPETLNVIEGLATAGSNATAVFQRSSATSAALG